VLRIGLRMLRERLSYIPSGNESIVKSRVVIIGAGDLGASLASDLLAKRHLGVEPVIFLDDDFTKIGYQIAGIDVLKIPNDFLSLKRQYSIDKAIVTTSKIPASRLSDITTALSRVGISVMIQPSYFDFAVGRTKLAPVREVNVLDVLGRKAIDLNDEIIGDNLFGKVVMVTGAGGSIGSELCRQIAMRKVDTLILVEHCEVQLFKIEQDLKSLKFGIQIKPFVANVCDAARMERIISRFKPQVIFHAAAHKHVPLMEYQPSEALKNNVLGTWTVADLSSRYGVEKFVLISTDKAVNPTNVMGASKRFAELVVQSMQNREGNNTCFVAVRFGNVLGSSGSVIPTFKKQIQMGGPVTLTHPDVTRYFMTIPEAVGLVLQCGAQARGGEIFVLDMGEPIKIIDLALRMITLSGFEPYKDIDIEIVGLRPGEKLYEELQNKDERLVRTEHERIFCFSCQPEKYEDVYANVKKILKISDSSSVNELKKFLKGVVAEYNVQYYD
ncbi:MAG: polysaccharide biosynthesis protein, partial [Opitutales bacterium]|nr:polysaccharide biosynthesis protein [Opitutales bacterium]